MKTNLREIFENSKMSGHELFSRAAAENRIVFGKKIRDCTTFRAGGPADVFVMPRTEAELADFAAVFLSLDIPVFALGQINPVQIAQHAEDIGEKLTEKPVTLAIQEVADGEITVDAADVVIREEAEAGKE